MVKKKVKEGPNFGLLEKNSVSLFDRLLSYGHSCAMIDSRMTNPPKTLQKINYLKVNDTDNDIIDKVIQQADQHTFTFAKLRQIENIYGKKIFKYVLN